MKVKLEGEQSSWYVAGVATPTSYNMGNEGKLLYDGDKELQRGLNMKDAVTWIEY
jgi:hypothetical protein